MEKTMTFNVSGMSCDHCKRHVENAAKEVQGVVKADVNLEAATLEVRASINVNEQNIVDLIDQAGYKAVVV